MKRASLACLLSLASISALALLAGCGSPSGTTSVPASPSAANLNLKFVASEDPAYPPGDISTSTANLTDQGLQRTLEMGSS